MDGKVIESLITEQGVVQEVASEGESIELLSTAVNFSSLSREKNFQIRFTEFSVLVAEAKYQH